MSAHSGQPGPPYGTGTTTGRSWVAAAGYPKTVPWRFDTVLAEAADGDIVLMHLGGWNTLPALQLIIPAERARGTVLTTVSDLRDGA